MYAMLYTLGVGGNMTIGPGSSKKVGKYRISIKKWDAIVLTIRREGERMALYKKRFSLRSAITLYKRLVSVGKVESFLMG